jgi:hypothetical protein
LDFFQLASSAFSILEGTTRAHASLSDQEVIDKLRIKEAELDALAKLESFASAHRYLAANKRKSDSHFILLLSIRDQSTTVEAFGSMPVAARRYAELEGKHLDDPLTDVVLVAAESVESVTYAYPNYFVDTRQFATLLESVTDMPVRSA